MGIGKPLGVSSSFRVDFPSPVEDAIWEAVCFAIREGWEPSRFKNEVAEAWGQKLREMARDAEKELSE